jgi:hypothetical protein
MSKNLPDELKPEPVLEVEAVVAVRFARQRPHPCHSEAGFIGEESAGYRAKQFPHATRPLRNDNSWGFSSDSYGGFTGT